MMMKSKNGGEDKICLPWSQLGPENSMGQSQSPCP